MLPPKLKATFPCRTDNRSFVAEALTANVTLYAAPPGPVEREKIACVVLLGILPANQFVAVAMSPLAALFQRASPGELITISVICVAQFGELDVVAHSWLVQKMPGSAGSV